MEGVEAATLGFLPSSISQGQIEQRYDRMRVDMHNLAIDIPVGYDTTDNQCVFRSLHATVGTASFIVFDRQGRFAWYLPDPKDMDRRLLERVLKRLTSE